MLHIQVCFQLPSDIYFFFDDFFGDLILILIKTTAKVKSQRKKAIEMVVDLSGDY